MSGPYQIPGGVNVRSLKRNAAGLLGWDGTGWFYMDSGPEEELAAEVIRLSDERARLREKVEGLRSDAKAKRETFAVSGRTGAAKWGAVERALTEVLALLAEPGEERVTAFGESEILVRRPGAGEYALGGRRIRKPTR